MDAYANPDGSLLWRPAFHIDVAVAPGHRDHRFILKAGLVWPTGHPVAPVAPVAPFPDSGHSTSVTVEVTKPRHGSGTLLLPVVPGV